MSYGNEIQYAVGLYFFF